MKFHRRFNMRVNMSVIIEFYDDDYSLFIIKDVSYILNKYILLSLSMQMNILFLK